MSVLAELSIFPLDKGVSLSPYVARAAKIIQSSGLNYVLGPMGTSIEGDWDELIKTVSKCFKDLEQDCSRIYLNLKIDYQGDREVRLSKKVEAVQDKMGDPAD